MTFVNLRYFPFFKITMSQQQQPLLTIPFHVHALSSSTEELRPTMRITDRTVVLRRKETDKPSTSNYYSQPTPPRVSDEVLRLTAKLHFQPLQQEHHSPITEQRVSTVSIEAVRSSGVPKSTSNNNNKVGGVGGAQSTPATAAATSTVLAVQDVLFVTNITTDIVIAVEVLPVGEGDNLYALALTDTGRMHVLRLEMVEASGNSPHSSLLPKKLSVCVLQSVEAPSHGTSSSSKGVPVALTVSTVPFPKSTNCSLNLCPFTVVYRSNADVAIHRAAASPTAPWGAASGSPIGGGDHSISKKKYSFKSAPVGAASQHAQDTMAVVEYSLLPGVVDIVCVDTSVVHFASTCTPMKQVRQAIDAAALSITLDAGFAIMPATISPKCITRNRTSTTFGWEVVLGVYRGPKSVVDAVSAQGVVIDGSLTKRGDMGRCIIKAVISHDVDEDEKEKVEDQIEIDATEKMPFGAALENESYMADTNSPFLCAAGNSRSTVPSFFHSGGKPPIQQRKGGNFATSSTSSTSTPIDDQIATDAVVAVQHLDIATPNNAPLIMYALPKVALIVDTKFSGGKSVIGIVNPPRSMGKGASIIAANIMVDFNENTCVCSLMVRGADRRLFKCDNTIKFENDHTEECIKIASIVCTSTTRVPSSSQQQPLVSSSVSSSTVGEEHQTKRRTNPQVLVGLVQIPARTPASELVCKIVPSTIPGLPRLDSSGNFTVWAAISERGDCVSLVDYYGTMTHSTPPTHSIPLSLPSSPSVAGDKPEVVTCAKVVYESGKLVCAIGYASGRISFWESTMDIAGGSISPPVLKYDRQLHDGTVSHLVYVGSNNHTRTSSDFRFISVSTSCGSVCLHRCEDYVRFGMLSGFSIDDLVGLYLDPPADYCLLINRSGKGTLYHTMSGRIDRILHNHSEALAHMAGKINLLVSSGSLEHGGGCLSVRNDTLIVNPILAIEQHIQGKQSVPVTVALGYAMGTLNAGTIRKHLGVAFSFPLAKHKALKSCTSNSTTTTLSSIQEGMVSLVVALASYSAVAGNTSEIPSDLIPDDWLSSTLQPHAAGLNDFLHCNREQSALLVKLVDALRPMMSSSDEMLAAAIALIRSALLKLSRGTLCSCCREASKEHAALPLELFASNLVPNDDNREFFLQAMGVRDSHSNLSRADEMMRFMRVVAACLIHCRTDRELEVVKQYTHEVEREIKSLCADVQGGVGLGLVAYNWGEFYKRCRDSPALMEAVLVSGWGEGSNNPQSRKALLHMFSILLSTPTGYEHAWGSIGRWFKTTPALRAPILKFLVNLVQRYPGTMVSTNSVTQILSYVWHALDPHNPNKAERDQTIPIATQFFRVAVGTLPTICFHQKSQRVVLGKPDGHVSLFDAKSTDEVATFAAFTPSTTAGAQQKQHICSLQAHSIIAVGYLTSSHDIAVLPADLSCVKIFSPVSTSTVGSFFAFVSSSAHSHYKLKRTVALDTPASLAVVSPSVAIGCNVVWLSPVCVEVTSPYHDRVQVVIPA